MKSLKISKLTFEVVKIRQRWKYEKIDVWLLDVYFNFSKNKKDENVEPIKIKLSEFWVSRLEF